MKGVITMKKALVIAVWTVTLMGTTFLAYREGYKDGKERKYDV